jgi:hypothetical protein
VAVVVAENVICPITKCGKLKEKIKAPMSGSGDMTVVHGAVMTVGQW